MELVPWKKNVPNDLWDAFDDLRSVMERSFGGFGLPDVTGLLDRTGSPAIDIIETSDEILVMADLPGVKKEDLELNLAGTLLTIKGSKKSEQNSDKRKIFRKETWVGSFARTIDLPANIDNEKVDAELKDGVLTVHISKKEEAKTKAISVRVN
jgi:HSP20 family protein